MRDYKTAAVGNKYAWYADRWLETVSLRLKETSVVKYRNIVTKRLKPSFGAQRIEAIDRPAIARFVQKLLAPARPPSARPLSSSTVKAILSVLSRTLAFARAELKLPPLDLKDLVVSPSRRAPVDVLTLAEQKRLRRLLVARCRDRPPLLGVFLSLACGLRIGEVCAMTWSDVDLQRRMLTVSRTMARIQTFKKKRGAKKTAVRFFSPKTRNSLRTIPISRETFALLDSMRVDRPDAFLLTGDENYIEPRALSNVFHNFLKECGIRRITYHTLRHSFATVWVEQGLNIKLLSEILGHGNTRFTMDVYVHASLTEKLKSLDALDRKFVG